MTNGSTVSHEGTKARSHEGQCHREFFEIGFNDPTLVRCSNQRRINPALAWSMSFKCRARVSSIMLRYAILFMNTVAKNESDSDW